MNETQRKILISTAVVVALMVIFPPYIVEFKGTVTTAGYGFLFDLPSRAVVNAKTLLVQIFGAAVVGGLAFLAAKR